MDDEITGWTAEGNPVFAAFGLSLKWTWPVWERVTGPGCLYLNVERQRNAKGKLRPYLILQIGRTLFQVGWLFG